MLRANRHIGFAANAVADAPGEAPFSRRVLPVVLWLGSFIASKYVPQLIRLFSLRLPLARYEVGTSGGDPLTSSSASASPSSPLFAAHGPRLLLQCVRRLLSLVQLPLRVLRWQSRNLLQPELPERMGSRLLSALLSCVSSLLLHAGYSALMDTFFTYLTIDTLDKYGRTLRDFGGALLAASLTNLYLLSTTRCVDAEGYFVRTASRPSSLSEARSRALQRLAPLAFVAVGLLSAINGYPLHMITQTRWNGLNEEDGSTVTTGGGSARRAGEDSAAPTAARSTAVSPASREGGRRGGTTAAASAGPAGVVYICDGKGFTYALAGFRLGYYDDAQQLNGAIWSFGIDVVELVMRRTMAGGTPALVPFDAARGGSASAAGGGVVVGGAGRMERVPEYLLRVSASRDIVRSYLAHFAAGFVVAFCARHLPTWWEEYQAYVPFLSRLVNWVFPPPPPPIDVPLALLEKASAQQNILRLSREDAVSGVLRCIEIPIPSECFCPITYSIMRDPVSTVDGFTYDREAMTEWLRVHETAPMTNLPLQSTKLRVNYDVRGKVEEIVRAYKSAMAELESGGEAPDAKATCEGATSVAETTAHKS